MMIVKSFHTKGIFISYMNQVFSLQSMYVAFDKVLFTNSCCV